MRTRPFLQNTVAAETNAKRLIYGSSRSGLILLSEQNTNPKNIVRPLESCQDIHGVPGFTICSSNFDRNACFLRELSLSQSDERAMLQVHFICMLSEISQNT